jgi:hypothetical protein
MIKHKIHTAVYTVKLSASKEELELRNDNKKKKMTSSKVNSKTQK